MLSTYSQSADERLRMGIKDAWASGGSSALTQFMELALQALVLSYGGACSILPLLFHSRMAVCATFLQDWPFSPARAT